jgi:hypothetical protein
MAADVKIVEQYLEYSPPINVHGSVRELLRAVPEKYLSGLHRITLTNSTSLRKTHRGKILAGKHRIRPADCHGLYANGQILLLMDQILSEVPEVFLLWPPLKKYLIAKTLYHEVGHHIHKLESPGYRADRETFADEWRDKFLRAFLKRYWYLAPAFRLVFAVMRPFRRSNASSENPSVHDTA